MVTWRRSCGYFQPQERNGYRLLKTTRKSVFKADPVFLGYTSRGFAMLEFQPSFAMRFTVRIA